MRIQPLLYILLTCLLSFRAVGASEIPDSTQEAISQLTASDTANFFKTLNTITLLSGRDAQLSKDIVSLLAAHPEVAKNHLFLLESLTFKAQNELLTGTPDSATKTLSQLGEIITPQDTNQLYGYYYLTAWVATEMNKLDLAKAYHLKGLELARHNKNYEKQIQFLDGLSTCTAEIDDRSVQINYLQQAKQIAEEHNIDSIDTYYSILYNLAGSLQQEGDVKAALEIYKQLSDIYQENNYTSGLAAIANNLAHAYKEEGDYKKAIQEANKALAYDKTTGTKMYILSDYITFAKIYKHKGDTDSTILYYNKADSIAVENHLLKKRREITLKKAEAYQDLGQYEAAYSALVEHLEVRDSFNIVDTKKKISELENHYQLLEVEKEKRQLTASIEKDKRLILFQTAGIILLLFLIAGIAYNLIHNRSINNKIRTLNTRLHQQNNELSELNDSKNKFFSIVSHDLRGPVGQLKELLSYISKHKDKYNRAQAFEYLDMAAQQLSTTYTFIEDLLLWSRSQANKNTCKLETLSLTSIANHACLPLHEIAKHKNIKIEQNIEGNPNVVADKNMLTFIIRNMVSNAIKFTHSDGNISLTGHQLGENYQIKIKDNGVGMSAEQINKLFKVGEESSTPGTNKEKGTGLGLILCKEFAEKNKITIDIESTEGKGSTFILQFSQLA